MRIGSSLSGIDLTAQHSLLRQLRELSLSSLRLSTMQRVNSGADDPAGVIAIGQMQSALTAVKEASYNACRAVGAVRVADSAMSEVSRLLGDIRGNAVAAAGGMLSDAEIAAKQIEIDAALEAIDRIGHTTSYGGRKLLDGQGGFEVSGLNPDQVADIEVSAYAGGSGTMPPIEVLQAATPASLTYTNEAGALEEDVTLQLSGDQGTVTLEFTAGTTLQQMAAAVGATTDQTGVSASVDGDELTFTSSAVGSDAGVAVEVVEGTFDLGQTTAASGGDVVVSVDGQQFTGEGNTVRVSTAGLEAEIELAEGFIGAVDPMTVSGGGLTFLLTPDVNQTSTLALPAVSTSALGGSAGRLSELATGGGAALAGGNLGQAIEILDAAQDQVLQGRARAGAFEKYTVESSQSLLGSMEETISSALSSIRDTDVAAEASRLVRSQILVDSAFSSLMLAGQRRSLIGGLLDPS